MTKDQHDRLTKLHFLIKINGIMNMTDTELDEYSALMAMSLKGKGDRVPV